MEQVTTENKQKETVESVVLYEIEKTPTEIIRISKGKAKGGVFFDFRVFYKDKETGEYKPTKKGFALKPDVFRNFVEMVVSSEKEVN